jgi:hypothetical protein
MTLSFFFRAIVRIESSGSDFNGTLLLRDHILLFLPKPLILLDFRSIKAARLLLGSIIGFSIFLINIDELMRL